MHRHGAAGDRLVALPVATSVYHKPDGALVISVVSTPSAALKPPALVLAVAGRRRRPSSEQRGG